MGYLIAAYGIVLGSLLAYGLWIQAQRRALMRQERRLAPGASADGAPRESSPQSSG